MKRVLFSQSLFTKVLSFFLQECGCQCESCSVDLNNLTDIHLHQEIEDLKGRLGEKEHQIVTMESQILVHANQYPHGEMAALRESLHSSADRYER